MDPNDSDWVSTMQIPGNRMLGAGSEMISLAENSVLVTSCTSRYDPKMAMGLGRLDWSRQVQVLPLGDHYGIQMNSTCQY